MDFRNFVALVNQVKHFMWQCTGTSWFSFPPFAALCSLMSHKDTVLCIFQTPFLICQFLPADIHLHHSQPFLNPALWRHATPLPSIFVLKCKSTQQSPTTKRLVVTSGFRGWCSIVSLWKSCHCGKTFSIMPCACQDVASRVKISQITYFSLVFSGKKTLSHGESET